MNWEVNGRKRGSIMKIKAIFLLLILILIGSGGCSMKQKRENKEEIILNERQKMILAESDLPIEYEELGYTQQRSIIAIEEMLQAVEAKYGMEFRYVGYILPGPLNGEKLVACAMDGYDSIDSFAVTREMVDGEYMYTDEYMCVAVRDMFNRYISDSVEKEMQIKGMKVYPEVTFTTLEEVPGDVTELDGNIAGSVMFFADNTLLSEEGVSSFATWYKKWMQEHQIPGIVDVIILEQGVLDKLTIFNYTDFLTDDYCIYRESFYWNN